MTGIFQVYDIWHIPAIYLVYTCHMKCHSIPGIYLAYTFQMKLCAPPGYRIAIENLKCSSTQLLDRKGVYCSAECGGATGDPSARARQWPLADSGLGGKVAPPTSVDSGWNRRHRRPLQRRRGRAAAAADAEVGGGGGVMQPPPTPTAAAARAHRHRRRRRRRRSESLVVSM
jgi:hypothetical protein